MKKRFLSLLVLSTALLTVSCGNTNTTTTNPSTPTTPIQTTPAPTTPTPSTPTPTTPIVTTPTPTTPVPSTPTTTPIPTTPTPTGLKDKYNCISVSEAIDLGIAAGSTVTTERYYIYGIVKSIDNAAYGQMTIEDGGKTLSAYNTSSADGTKGYSELESKPVAGDEIVLYSTLHAFKGEAEIKSGWIIEFIHKDPIISPDDYKEMSIASARSENEESLVQVTGVVSRITFANGKKPNGFFLVDETSSIYVFDSQIAQQVEIGNKLTIAGKKDRWILETEQTNAAKYGYEGSNQIIECILLSNDNGTNAFDSSWIEETTVKNLMNTPVSEDITGLIYKTNALVKKAPGDGFVNYYLNDLDEKTGSYVYTQCNGSDFDWLDEFDGKICTVYMTAINAKSSASGCVWRFVPISVSNDNYTFDKANTTQFVYDYYIAEQFTERYTGDPVMEVTTSVSSELLGFENATISYSSSNTESVYFETSGDKIIMHTNSTGNAEITIKVNYDTYPELERKINIAVANIDEIQALTVKQAIDAEVGTEVIVKGIAGPSVVNKTGFYIIDETGSIAITMSEADLATVSLGNEIIIKATRTQVKAEETYPGHSALLDATIVANLYGKQDYSTASFVTDKTLTDLAEIPTTTDDTTQVYVLDASVKKTSSAYATVYSVTDGTSTITLYSASGNQYSWLEPYVDQTVTMEFALCNWNKKNPYKGIVLAVYDNGNKVINTLNYSK